MTMSLQEARAVLAKGPQPGADAYVRYSTAAAVAYMAHERRAGRVTADAAPRRKLSKAALRDVLGLIADARAEVRRVIDTLPPREQPNSTMMGGGHPWTPEMQRLSGGTGMSAAEMALWQRTMQREISNDANWNRRSLAAINAHNKRKWRQG
jgi:hypothetical protein